MIDIGGVKLEKISIISFILFVYMFLIFKIKHLLKNKAKDIKRK